MILRGNSSSLPKNDVNERERGKKARSKCAVFVEDEGQKKEREVRARHEWKIEQTVLKHYRENKISSKVYEQYRWKHVRGMYVFVVLQRDIFFAIYLFDPFSLSLSHSMLFFFLFLLILVCKKSTREKNRLKRGNEKKKGYLTSMIVTDRGCVLFLCGYRSQMSNLSFFYSLLTWKIFTSMIGQNKEQPSKCF